jgi:trimeric autotransporter adhesin
MKTHREQGFTAIELLITLFVAAAFLVAGYQLYFVIIKDNGNTRAQAKAANVAYNYLRQYSANTTAPCSASLPLVNSPVSVSGLTNTTISVTVSCPYSTSTGTNNTQNISRIDVAITYGATPQTLTYSTLVHDAPTSTTTTDITNGLVGWWKFNGDATASVGVGGTVNGATLTTGETGKPNSAYSFNGSSQYISVPSTFGLGSTNITMSLWVKNVATPNSGDFIKIGNNSDGTGGYGYGVGIGATTFDNSNPGNNLIGLFEVYRWIPTSQTVTLGWHYIVMMIDGSGVPSLYEDGALVGTYSGTNSGAPTGGMTYIGAGMGTSLYRFFNGAIDDVRIYNRTLTPQEINTLYDNGAQ